MSSNRITVTRVQRYAISEPVVDNVDHQDRLVAAVPVGADAVADSPEYTGGSDYTGAAEHTGTSDHTGASEYTSPPGFVMPAASTIGNTFGNTHGDAFTVSSSVGSQPTDSVRDSGITAAASSRTIAPTSAAPTSVNRLVPRTPVSPNRESVKLGWLPGQPHLYKTWGMPAQTPKAVLATQNSAIPELEDSGEESRSIWRQPAFIVSLALSFVALLGFAGVLVFNSLQGDQVKVTDLAISQGQGNVVLTWEGPNEPYSLFVVDGSAVPTDLSDLVQGREAWIPKSANLFTQSSCFVVRAASVGDDNMVTTNADVLEEQGGQSVCLGVSDEK